MRVLYLKLDAMQCIGGWDFEIAMNECSAAYSVWDVDQIFVTVRVFFSGSGIPRPELCFLDRTNSTRVSQQRGGLKWRLLEAKMRAWRAGDTETERGVDLHMSVLWYLRTMKHVTGLELALRFGSIAVGCRILQCRYVSIYVQ